MAVGDTQSALSDGEFVARQLEESVRIAHPSENRKMEVQVLERQHTYIQLMSQHEVILPT